MTDRKILDALACPQQLITMAWTVALVLGFPALAQARVTCAYTGPPQNAMTVTVSGTSEGVVIRRGLEIVAMEPSRPAQPCAGGVPSVANTDTIHVTFQQSHDTAVELQLTGGPFAPGATDEGDGSSEIEIDVRGDTGLAARVVGTPRDDRFWWVAAGAHAGLNLNPDMADDHDVDVTIASANGSRPQLVALGAAGEDTIIGDPASRGAGGAFTDGGPGDDTLGAFGSDGSYLYGGSGNDVMTGGAYDDILSGATGNDRISGLGGADTIFPGPGTDRVSGGSGRDRVVARDRTRDVVTCGPGRDRVTVDRRDVVRDCEQRSRR